MCAVLARSARRALLILIWGSGRLVQSENGKQGSVDTPLFFWCQMAGQVTKLIDIDRTNLFDKNTS
jgi:hypothetical protein